ncbi:MAG: alpha/beta fold hydrolase [Nitrospirae bacterium]|nr:alpha/beta fold hydrolase [Nitrospirota bacterium]
MKAHINGIDLAYTDQGRGTPLVFVHAFPLGKAMWAPQVQALSARCRVITVDLRGHGESEAPLWRYTMDQFADDLKGLLDHLAIRQAVMAGLSMGGYVLFAFYRKFPDRVKGLVLADTRAREDSEEGRAGRFAMAQLAYKNGASAIADAMLPKLLSQASLHGRPELVQQVRAIITATQVSGIAGDLMGMAERLDSVPLLKAIACPTLVIVGEQDTATPPADARLMADAIPGARLAIIPAAAHLANLEQPEAFNRAVDSFLESVE